MQFSASLVFPELTKGGILVVKALRFLTKIIEYFCAAAMIIMSVIVFIQAGYRYIIGKSFAWAEDLSILLMIWVTFLGGTLAIPKSQHSRIDFLVKKLPKKLQKIVWVVDYLICAAFVILLAIHSVQIVKAKWGLISPGFPVSSGLWPLAATVGGGLMALYLIIMALSEAFGWDIGGEKS